MMRRFLIIFVVLFSGSAVGADSTTLNGLPAELAAKVREIVAACGSTVLSTWRPHSMICNRRHCRPSEHAMGRAADVAGNPDCIYAHLKGWPGGYSTDYRVMGHVHISYNPHGPEWGVLFVHGGGWSR